MITFDDIFKTGFEYLQNFYANDKVSGISTDSRTLKKGEAFFAIIGEKFDGHKFIKEAFDKGASLSVVNYSWYIKNRDYFKDQPILVVQDTVKALGDFARNYRQKFNIPTIAIAGSNGKTTTKDIIADILSKKYNVLKTEGNLNNHIGVPLMIFKIRKNTEIAIIELGTNHPGEMEYLCNILNPNFGLITNIGKEHLEFFKDLEGVMQEETTLFRYLKDNNGFAFVNYDDPWLKNASKNLRNKLTYGFNKKSDYYGSTSISKSGNNTLSIYSGGKKVLSVNPSLPGRHNCANFLASAVVGLKFSVKRNDIKKAIEEFKPAFGRMEIINNKGIMIIKDCYNSNPDSLRLGLETLAKIKYGSRKFVVLGDMLEIGERAPEEHRLAGEIIKRLGLDNIFLYGDYSKYIYKELQKYPKFCKHFEDKILLAKELKSTVKEGDTIYIKGSRGMKMETIVDYLINGENTN